MQDDSWFRNISIRFHKKFRYADNNFCISIKSQAHEKGLSVSIHIVKGCTSSLLQKMDLKRTAMSPWYIIGSGTPIDPRNLSLLILYIYTRRMFISFIKNKRTDLKTLKHNCIISAYYLISNLCSPSKKY